MGSLYLTDLADWIASAGIPVVEWDGWQRRSNNSGGFNDWPLCVMWHHTASSPSADGWNDASYIATGADVAPIANLYIDRSGCVWVIAAGKTNTNGKGRSLTFSRGIVPADCMNSYALGVEMGNNGVGERWPRVQVDAMFTVSNLCNARFGNQPSDVSSHQNYAPDRKVDPATTNVEPPWIPSAVTSAGTWSTPDIQSECLARAATLPNAGDDMTCTLFELTDADAVFVGMTSDGVGTDCSWCDANRANRFRAIPTVVRRPTTVAELQSMILLGPMPANDSRHHWVDGDFFAVIQ